MATHIASFVFGMFCFAGLLSIDQKSTVFYFNGVKATHKEAFERGFMVKEITKDDEVIYKWKDSK